MGIWFPLPIVRCSTWIQSGINGVEMVGVVVVDVDAAVVVVVVVVVVVRRG